MSENNNKSSGLTVHHLQRGQSERILWLLEETDIPYNLVIHKRDPLLAPASIKSLHELGTAPTIEDGDVVMAESMAIVTYILDKYAKGNSVADSLVRKVDSPGYTDYIYWLYFVLCTLQPSESGVMLAYFDKTITDDAAMVRAFPRQRFLRNVGLVEKRLAEKKYLAGDEFTLVDILALWVFTTPRVFIPYSLAPFPNILEWVQRMTSREAYKRAMDKGDHGLPILNGAEPGDKKAVF